MSFKFFAGLNQSTNSGILALSNSGSLAENFGIGNAILPPNYESSIFAANIIYDSRKKYLKKLYEGINLSLGLPGRAIAASSNYFYPIASFTANISDGMPLCMGKLHSDPYYAPIVASHVDTLYSPTSGHLRQLAFSAKATHLAGNSYTVTVYALEFYSGQSAPGVTLSIDVVVLGT